MRRAMAKKLNQSVFFLLSVLRYLITAILFHTNWSVVKCLVIYRFEPRLIRLIIKPPD